MNLGFAAVVIVVLFLGAPSLESIGARAQAWRNATPAECEDACSAAARRDSSVIRRYISRRIRLCHCVCSSANGGGILHVSVTGGCGVCINLLTTSPSNCYCDDRDNNRNTPLHIAANICSAPMISRAIDAGCNKNARNGAGNTPLCLAAISAVSGECGLVARTLLSSNTRGGRANPCIICSTGRIACRSCPPNDPNTCNVIDQDRGCNC